VGVCGWINNSVITCVMFYMSLLGKQLQPHDPTCVHVDR
jgi:hypothetical protein